MIEVRGAVGAPGIVTGSIVLYRPVTEPGEASFADRRDRAVGYFTTLGERLRAAGRRDEAAIFDAQALLAADAALAAAVASRPQTSVPDAIRAAIDELAAPLEALPDPHLRERASDIRAVGAALLGEDRPPELPAGAILVARDLTPAETVNLPLGAVAGLATAMGSPTSHTAILARSLGIPSVVGLGEEVLAVPDGTTAILDGQAGLLILDPDRSTIARYKDLRAAQKAAAARRTALIDLPAETVDGWHIGIWANTGSLPEVQAAIDAGAEGIGLLRTEFLFLQRSTPPSEDEQFAAYLSVLRIVAERPVVVRTLDVGGDKPLSYLAMAHEPNPFLGVRGIRFSQHFPELFRTQLRALLRAAASGDIRIMLPMIATVADLDWARRELAAVVDALRAAGEDFRDEIPLGIMIETPAAVIMADRLAAQVAFFSVGSNDLAQYTLAADRTVAQLAGRYSGDDPAVYRLIAMAVAGARNAGIPVGVCGELAGDPDAAVALMGLGVDELSMAPGSIGAVKERIRATTCAAAEQAGLRACDR